MHPVQAERKYQPYEGLRSQNRRISNAILLAIAAAVTLLHLLTGNRYGFHRDELQFLSDARHLDWGFVSYPPFTPVVERLALSLFGLSMTGLRLFSMLAQGAAIVTGGLMARELGGRRMAQVTAALAVAFSPISLFEGTQFQYTSFDFLWWVLIAYFVLRLLNSENPRWWLAIGAVIGIGLETKYSIVFYIAGILAGVAFTSARRFLRSRWFWTGVGLALLIFLPNFIWLARHNFISYDFLRHIHARDVALGRANGFWRDQFLLCANFAAVPLWLAGLVGFARNPRYRMLAYMYAVPVAIFWLSKGRGYYTAGAYPAITAMGIVMAARTLAPLPAITRRTAFIAWSAEFVAISACLCAVILPIASGGALLKFALDRNSDLREEFGWNEMVRSVASIRDTLTPAQRASYGIVTGNYGEQGAIELLGPAYHLPPPISATNSAWLRGYPTPAPTTLIVLGHTRAEADQDFTACRLAGHNGNSRNIQNEESRFHPDIFVCGPPRLPWPELWKHALNFG
jgi:Dolichyl-phosphate-mannose-protein mannosyltransferase